MASIVQGESQGRIINFFGTKLLAIFGEHEDNPSKAATSAVYAATLMVKKFRELKLEFLEKAFGKNYDIEHNESIDINLGVGVDYGKVLFEYLGNERHRDYTVIGEHVSFAEFLEKQTYQYDQKGTENPSILVGQTIERCTLPWIEPNSKTRLHLSDNDKGYTYKVCGIAFDGFSEDYFLKCKKDDSWDSAWENEEASLPS